MGNFSGKVVVESTKKMSLTYLIKHTLSEGKRYFQWKKGNYGDKVILKPY